MNTQQNNTVGIIATGHYLPDSPIDNQHFIHRGLDTTDEWISTRSGIKTRHIAQNETTSDLAYTAAKNAIESSNLSTDDIDFIIVATATPDHHGFPSTACLVQKKLNCKRHIPAFDITAACSGFTYAIGIGQSYIKSGMGTHGLIIGAETLSSLVDWSDRSTCVLFGDGAGATIIGPVSGKGIIGIDQGADGNFSDILSVQQKENSEDFFEQHHVNNRDIISMEGRAVFKQGIQCVQSSLNNLLDKTNTTISDITHIIPHQANIRILENIAEKFDIPFDRFLTNIDRVGNTSAASIPIILSEENKNQTFKQGDILYLIGFGAGFTWAGILLEWSN